MIGRCVKLVWKISLLISARLEIRLMMYRIWQHSFYVAVLLLQ